MEDLFKYIGLGAFWFFLIKGIIWILVFLFAGNKLKNSKWFKKNKNEDTKP